MRVYSKGDLLHDKVHGAILQVDSIKDETTNEYWLNIVYSKEIVAYRDHFYQLILPSAVLDTMELVTGNKLIKELID